MYLRASLRKTQGKLTTNRNHRNQRNPANILPIHRSLPPPDTSPIPGQQTTDYLASWLDQADSPAFATDRLWRLLHTDRLPAFADLWYSARDAGEHLRRLALSALSLSRPHPGGAHPDPREPAAFSHNAILASAARTLGLKIWQIPDSNGTRGEHGGHGRPSEPIAWLITYPQLPQPRPPDIATRAAVTSDAPAQRFEIACLLGFVCKERPRLADHDAPAAVLFLPQDPAIVTVLHQFAIGLLGLPRDCPIAWTCACNAIRERFNAPPPDHEQPTDALSLADIRRLIS